MKDQCLLEVQTAVHLCCFLVAELSWAEGGTSPEEQQSAAVAGTEAAGVRVSGAVAGTVAAVAETETAEVLAETVSVEFVVETEAVGAAAPAVEVETAVGQRPKETPETAETESQMTEALKQSAEAWS